jgi:hypothetical protein
MHRLSEVFVLRQAQHERKISRDGGFYPFALSLSKPVLSLVEG